MIKNAQSIKELTKRNKKKKKKQQFLLKEKKRKIIIPTYFDLDDDLDLLLDRSWERDLRLSLERSLRDLDLLRDLRRDRDLRWQQNVQDFKTNFNKFTLKGKEETRKKEKERKVNNIQLNIIQREEGTIRIPLKMPLPHPNYRWITEEQIVLHNSADWLVNKQDATLYSSILAAF